MLRLLRTATSCMARGRSAVWCQTTVFSQAARRGRPRSPLSWPCTARCRVRNMQAFDGSRFVDLYPALGIEGAVGSPGEPMLSDISFDDVARFICRRPSDLAESIPGTGMVVVQRRLGDEMCYVYPFGPLTEAARRNTWEIRLRVNRGCCGSQFRRVCANGVRVCQTRDCGRRNGGTAQVRLPTALFWHLSDL